MKFLNVTYTTWWFFGNGWTVTWPSYSPNLNPSEFLLPGAHEINSVRNIHGFHGRSRYCSYSSGQTPAGTWHKSLRKYAPVSFNSLNYSEAPFDCSIDGDDRNLNSHFSLLLSYLCMHNGVLFTTKSTTLNLFLNWLFPHLFLR